MNFIWIRKTIDLSTRLYILKMLIKNCFTVKAVIAYIIAVEMPCKGKQNTTFGHIGFTKLFIHNWQKIQFDKTGLIT